jgi:hypothetical protein
MRYVIVFAAVIGVTVLATAARTAEKPADPSPPPRAAGAQQTTIVSEGPEGAVSATAIADPGLGGEVTGPMTVTIQAGPAYDAGNVPALGLGVGRASEILRRQLGLAPGTGLVVERVAEKGPARDAGVEVYDVLVRLGEQALTAPAQLAALLKPMKTGQKVRLALVRAGKEQTVPVTVAEVPAEAEGPAAAGRAVAAHAAAGEGVHMSSVVVSRGGAGEAATLSRRSWSDGRHTLHLTERGDRKNLLVQDHEGEVVFSGPVDTDEQRKTLPPEVRAKLQRMEARQAAMPARIRLGDAVGGNVPLPQGPGPTPPAEPATPVLGATVTVTMTEDGITLTLTATDAGHHLVAKTTVGKVLFEGPVETAEQRKAVPEEVRNILERLATACGNIFFGK